VRALLKAAAGRELRLMIPMVSVATEMDEVRALIDKEREVADKCGIKLPCKFLVGAMIEVPSVLFELDELLARVDFVSVGSNDLMQFLFAADRSNARVANRFDSLSAASLRALKVLADASRKHRVPLTLCGEMAGRPIEAMALIGLGIRTLSMAPASIGPVKTMIRQINAAEVTRHLEGLLLGGRTGSLRKDLEAFAAARAIEL